jgi:hypothetical protein
MSDVGINLLSIVLLFLLFRSKVGDVGRSTSKRKRKRKSLTRGHGSATH